jgi:glycosyltransferase
MSVTVTLITVCWNSAATIRDTIESVLAQDYPHIDYVIVDGVSTDGTLDIVRAYRERSGDRHGDRIRLLSERDRGMYDSLNKGLAMARGDVVGLIHSDDMLAAPDTISRIAEAFRDPAVECVYGDLDMVDPQDTRKVVRHWRSRLHRPGDLPRGWYPPHVTLYIRRSVLQEVGPFDLRYRIAADMDHMVRLFEVRGMRCVHLPQVLVRMRAGGASNRSLRNIWRANVETWRSLRSHGFRVGPWFIVFKLMRKIPQLFVRRAEGG